MSNDSTTTTTTPSGLSGTTSSTTPGTTTTTPANQAISLINGPAADGYPIVNYEYAIVNGGQKDAATAQTMQAFLHWAVTEGNAPTFLDKVHFQPLPDSVVKLSDAQIAKITG